MTLTSPPPLIPATLRSKTSLMRKKKLQVIIQRRKHVIRIQLKQKMKLNPVIMPVILQPEQEIRNVMSLNQIQQSISILGPREASRFREQQHILVNSSYFLQHQERGRLHHQNLDHQQRNQDCLHHHPTNTPHHCHQQGSQSQDNPPDHHCSVNQTLQRTE